MGLEAFADILGGAQSFFAIHEPLEQVKEDPNRDGVETQFLYQSCPVLLEIPVEPSSGVGTKIIQA